LLLKCVWFITIIDNNYTVAMKGFGAQGDIAELIALRYW